MKLQDWFKTRGYDVTDYLYMLPFINDWKSWYQGNVEQFHNYSIYNGNKEVKCNKLSLNMAKRVSEDFANYLMNEKVKFKFENEGNQAFIDKVLSKNSFYVKANMAIEKAFAFGTGAFVIKLNDLIYDENTGLIDYSQSNIVIEYATADKIIPLSYTDDKITECAFAVSRTIKDKKYLDVSIHKINENGFYEIENHRLEINTQSKDLSEVDPDSAINYNTMSDKPWFFILKPNISNNVTEEVPYGISIFANGISELKQIDTTYDSLYNEFSLGRKRLFLREEMTKVDEYGERKVFDTNDVLFYQLPNGATFEGQNTPIQEVNPALRIADHEQGLQVGLNLLSSACGMGNNIYKFERGNVTTATQIISEDSDLYKSIKKHEIILDDILTDMMSSLLDIGSRLLNYPVTEEIVTIDFDDSIIEDKNAIKQQALIEFNAGLIDAVEYFMITRNYSEEQAIDYVNKIMQRMPKPVEDDFEE